MNTEQALQILAQASRMANMPFEGHAQCQQAVQVLADFIKPKEEPK